MRALIVAVLRGCPLMVHESYRTVLVGEARRLGDERWPAASCATPLATVEEAGPRRLRTGRRGRALRCRGIRGGRF